MSPLSLPHGVSGYFDYPDSKRLTRDDTPAITTAQGIPGSTSNFHTISYPAVYSPLSPGARGPPVPQSMQFLSPNLHPITQDMHYQPQQQQRSASMSPTGRIPGRAGTLVRSRSTITSPSRSTPAVVSISPPATNGIYGVPNGSIPPTAAAPTSCPRSILEGAASDSSHIHMIRRLVQQNGRIREAWEAERKYMEANRERVEEVYKEERALMEEERAEWEFEKEALLKKIDLLQQQVAGLCGYSSRKNDLPAKGKARHGAGSDWNMSPESMRSSASSQGSVLPDRNANGGGSLGSGDVLHKVPSYPSQPIRDAHLQTTLGQHATALRFSSSRQTEPSPFVSFPNNGMASPPKEDNVPVPIVDVQEIIPTSEGIPIKASAVQKTTFSDRPISPPTSKPSSRTSSPPADTSRLGGPGKPVKEQTRQVLAADAVLRLTMHAGHTPSHSLSVLPTVTATTASSSGGSTPTLQHGELIDTSVAASSSEPTEPPTTRKGEISEGHSSYPEEAELDAGPGDAPLRGPLMVRNMPAHDEIFFRRLSDKLEEVSKGAEAAVPAVLRHVTQQDESSDMKPTNNRDEAAAAKAQSDNSSPRSREEEEIEVPLKLKRNNNFGAPFGEYR